MKNNILVISGLILGLLSSSCEDALTEQPESLLVKENFYKNGADALSALTSVYGIFSREGEFPTIFYMSLLENRSDYSEGRGSQAGFSTYDSPMDNTSQSRVFAAYNDLYQGINRANAVIDNVGGIENMNTEEAEIYKESLEIKFVTTIKEDKIFGRGTCDMKGFIACTLAYAPIFAKNNLDRDIHFSFTFDEETACQGAPILINELKKKGINSGICIVGEPTNMKIVDAHKGCYEYTTHFEGLAGHGSKPDKGVNAVEFAVRYINKLMELRETLKANAPKNCIFDPPYTTLQIGGISGGIARNVIADKCRVDWELRPVVKEDGELVNNQMDEFANKKLLPEMKKIFPKSTIKKEVIGEIIGFNRIENSEACEFISNLTGDNSKEVVSFGTEAGLFQEIGISTVVCGPGSIEQAHKVDEFITLEQIKKCLLLLENINKTSNKN